MSGKLSTSPADATPTDQDDTTGDPQVSQEEEGQPLNTVVVRGLNPATKDDTIKQYFQLKKRSGGGPVQDVWNADEKAGEKLVWVVFKNPEDAKNVVDPSKVHKIDGYTLDVQLKRMAGLLKNYLLFRNLDDFVSEDHFRLFMEKTLQKNLPMIRFDPDGELALVRFENEEDTANLKTEISRSKYKDVRMERVSNSGKLLVSPLPPGTSEDSLQFHFESEEGGEVDVALVQVYEDYALVTLEDPEVAPGVAERVHQLDGTTLDVSLFFPCLGPSGGLDHMPFNVPQPLTLTSDLSEKVKLLLQDVQFEQSLSGVLNRCYATIKADTGSGQAVGGTEPASGDVRVYCTLIEGIAKGRRLLKTWAEETHGALLEHISAIQFEEESLLPEEYELVKSRLEEEAEKGDMTVLYQRQQKKLFMLLVHSDQQEVVQRVKAITKEVKEKHYRSINKVTLTKEMYVQIKKMLEEVLHEVGEKFPELEVSYEENCERLHLTGLQHEVDVMAQRLQRGIDAITSCTQTFDPDLVSLLPTFPCAKEVIEKACQEADPQGTVRFTANQSFTVFSRDATKAKAMQTAGQQVTKKKVIKLEHLPHRQAVEHPDFVDLLKKIPRRNLGLMDVVLREQPPEIVCLGLNTNFESEVQVLEDWLDRLCVYEKSYPMDNIQQLIFRACLQNRKILPGVADSLKFEFNPEDGTVGVRGSEAALEEVGTAYELFMSSLITESKEFTKPGLQDYLLSAQGHRKLQALLDDLNCLVAQVKSPASAEAQPSVVRSQAAVPDPLQQTLAPREFDNPDTHQDASLTDDNATAEPQAQVPRKPRIFIKKLSDITKEEHDFLVNSSNTNLDLSRGQVAQALLQVGGSELQEDCAQHYPNGIQMGEIAVTGPGRSREDAKRDGKRRLDCKYILHCCLPQLDHQHQHRMTKVVRKAVRNCLKEAEKLVPGKTGKSIGFPALGAGTLKYPPKLVADAMFKTVVDYGNENPETAIADVFFILHKKDTDLTKVFDAAYAEYDQMRADSREREDGNLYRELLQQGATGIKSYPFFEKSGSRVSLEFTGVSQADIDEAIDDLLKDYRDTVVEIDTDVNNLSNWDESFIRQLIMTHRVANVDVTINFDLGRLTLRGLRENVNQTLLHNMVKEAETDQMDRQFASLTAYTVQWCFEKTEVTETTLIPYDIVNNYRIEKAYKGGGKGVVIFDRNRTTFFVHFTKMIEQPEVIPKDDKYDVFKIVRKDNITEVAIDVPPPDHWLPMNQTTLDLVTLPEDSREFERVEHMFRDTLQNSTVRIVKIQRVQNLMLYKQYMSLKKQMSRQGELKVEEYPLWHGTSQEVREGSRDEVVANISKGFNVVDSIIKNGFNRSYCNRTNYGQGVYFAKTAHYSSEEKYAMKNDNGERHIFCCRVLVGRYCKGSDDMRFPPAVPGEAGGHYDSSVDEVDDPSVFVAFHDAQAYPDYLIVFSD